jgi:hypothetical protein
LSDLNAGCFHDKGMSKKPNLVVERSRNDIGNQVFSLRLRSVTVLFGHPLCAISFQEIF